MVITIKHYHRRGKNLQSFPIGIVIIVLSITIGAYFMFFAKVNNDDGRVIQPDTNLNKTDSPVCGNGLCESYNGVNEETSCQADCHISGTIQKPVCGNGVCESFGGVDELLTCGYGTSNDCGVVCLPQQCYPGCPAGVCSSNYNPLNQPNITNKNYNVKIYYVYNEGKRDSLAVSNILPAFNKASDMLKDFDGVTLTSTLEEVPINYNLETCTNRLNYGEYVNMWVELSSRTNLKADVNSYDTIVIIYGAMYVDTVAWVYNYKSPIYFGEYLFDDTNLYGCGSLSCFCDLDRLQARADVILHEFFHTFGCKDIYRGSNCIMEGVLNDRVKSLTVDTMCECDSYFKAANYGKQPYKEYVLEQQLFSFYKFDKLVHGPKGKLSI